MSLRLTIATLTAALLALPAGASAGIIDDLASATILEDFQFGDASGTTIDAAANTANPGNSFDSDSDTADIVTNGTGQLDVSLKNNTSFGTNYVDNPGKIETGRVFGVMELTWDFDRNVFEPTQDEELRITLINNPPRGSQVTAEVEIQRNGLEDLVIQGSATGGDAVGPVALNLTQTSKFIMVVDADLDADIYSIHFSDDAGVTFSSLGPESITSDRGVEALRMVINEDFVGDNVLIDRVYLALAAPVVPEPSSAMLALLALAPLWRRRR